MKQINKLKPYNKGVDSQFFFSLLVSIIKGYHIVRTFLNLKATCKEKKKIKTKIQNLGLLKRLPITLII